jgi:lipoate-protein ligase A
VARYLTFASEQKRQALATHLRERATTLSDALGHSTPFSAVAQAMARGFAEALNVDLTPGEPAANEVAAAHRIHDHKLAELTEALQAS